MPIVVNVPDIPIVVPPEIAFEATLENVCPDTCTTVEVRDRRGHRHEHPRNGGQRPAGEP